MTGAEGIVHLVFRHAEEVHAVAEPVALKPLSTEHRVFMGNGKRGVISPTLAPFIERTVFDLVERPKQALGLGLECFDPALHTLLTGQEHGLSAFHISDSSEFGKRLVLHVSFSFEKTWCQPHLETRADRPQTQASRQIPNA